MSVSISFAQAPKEKMISFFFLGHSNMGGYCSALDTTEHSRVWCWDKDKGFYHPRDPIKPRWTNESGNPVIPFLKRMALLYPDYEFCGCMYGCPCNQAWHILAEGGHRNYITKRLNELNEHTTLGGILLMYGFIEGQHQEEVKRLDTAIQNLITALRGIAGNPALPVILGRYEMLGKKVLPETYHRWDSLMLEKISAVGRYFPNTYLTPFRFVPAPYYCDDHHYTAEGYRIWSEDAAAIIQLCRQDFWFKP